MNFSEFMRNVGLAGLVANKGYISPDSVPVSRYGIFPLAANDTTTNQYSLLLTAVAAASAGGFDLSFEAGRYNFLGGSNGMLTGLKCGFRGVPKKTKIYLMNAGGLNVRWDWYNSGSADGLSDITVYGLDFYVPNTPSTATNDASEPSIILRFGNATNVTIEKCRCFGADQVTGGPYGVFIMLRSVTRSVVRDCQANGCYKDSFHVTGLSSDILYDNCEVNNGGDDGFAVVGYKTTGGTATLGQPTRIAHLNCRVNGVKFARCMTYVGSKDCLNIGLRVDGKIPARFNPVNPFGVYGATTHGSGLYIAEEILTGKGTADYTTYGNENLRINSAQVKNCGRGTLTAVHITGGNQSTTDGIFIDGLTVDKSGGRGLYVAGGTLFVNNLRVRGLKISETDDPNGVNGAPFGNPQPGFEILNAKDISIEASLYDTGSYGAWIQTANGGVHNYDLTTYRINRSGLAGNDIVFVGTNPTFEKMYCKLRIVEQAQVNSAGTAYFIDRVVDATATNGRCTWEIESPTALLKSVLVPATAITNVSIPAGSQTNVTSIVNKGRDPVLYTFTGGTAVTPPQVGTVVGSDGADIGSPVYNTVSSVKAAGLFVLKPGQGFNLPAYTTAPTITATRIAGV